MCGLEPFLPTKAIDPYPSGQNVPNSGSNGVGGEWNFDGRFGLLNNSPSTACGPEARGDDRLGRNKSARFF